MEDSNKKHSQEDLKPDPKLKHSSISLDDGKEMAIKPISKGIDVDSSSRETDDISKDSPLNEEQVVKIFKTRIDSATQALKDEVKTEGQEIKKDFLTIFGLFASFVTFLSIEVQLFKNKDNVLELVGISSISLSFVIFFALVINDIVKDKSGWKDFLKPIYIFNMFFAVIGTVFLYIGGTSSIKHIDTIENQIKSDSSIIKSQNLEIQKLKWKLETLDSIMKQTTLTK
jgi:hypothetical protein